TIVAVSGSPSGSLSLASTSTVPVVSSSITSASSTAIGAWLTITVTAADWSWNGLLEPCARTRAANTQLLANAGVEFVPAGKTPGITVKSVSVGCLTRYWNSGMTPAGHVAFACKAIAAPVANTEPSRGASSTTAVHGEVLACTVTPSVFDVNVVVVPLIRTL